MKRKYLTYPVFAVIVAIWMYVYVKGEGEVTADVIFKVLVGSALTFIILYGFYLAFFDRSYKRKRAQVEWIKKERHKKQQQMLVWMQFNSVSEALVKIKRLFKENKELKLHRYIPFRVWYKHNIDYMLEKPEIYHMTLKGAPYSKEEDPMYYHDAPDWDQFDRVRTYDYDDDDYFDDGFDEHGTTGRRLKDAAEEGLYMGIGFGAAHDTIDDCSHSGGE